MLILHGENRVDQQLGQDQGTRRSVQVRGASPPWRLSLDERSAGKGQNDVLVWKQGRLEDLILRCDRDCPYTNLHENRDGIFNEGKIS